MRRAVLTILLLFPFITAIADNVTKQEARAIAESFFGVDSQTKAGGNGLELVWDGETSATKASVNEPAFYVYEYENGGFVIISGDDIASPVLAYSRDSKFRTDNMPDNVAYWFESLRSAINEGRAKGYKATDKVATQWDEFRRSGSVKAGTPVTYYETAAWDQGSPYNNLCPKDGGASSYTGCAATALAIVLRHHCYPAHGTGTTPAYTTGSKSIKVAANPVSEHNYDWDNMPLKYTSSWTDEQKTQVAQIMLDCGTALKMDYTSAGSGASSGSYRGAVVNYFGMSPEAYVIGGSAYSTIEWETKLKDELDAVGPVVYAAQSNSGGHAFVVDGYDSEDYFHINFGWSGSSNTYCKFPTFKGGGYNFNQSHEALFNLVPAKGDESGEDVVWLEEGSYANVLSCSTDTFTQSESFTVYTGELHWSSIDLSNFETAIAHTDYYGNVKDIVSEIDTFNDDPIYYYGGLYYTCKIKSPIENMDKLIMVYRYARGEWKAVTCPHGQGVTDAIYLTDKDLDAGTDFEYNKESKIITINTVSGVSASLKDASGNKISDAINKELKVITIDTSLLPAGTYTLKLTKGSNDKTIQITTGE